MKKTRERYIVNETETLTLDKDLVERLRYAAEWKGVPFQEAAEQALTQYLGRFGREKIEVEQKAFEAMRAKLLLKYRGKYVAVHNGEVVAHASDLNALHKKVFARFGFTPVLHKRVTDEPERDIVIRSPRLEAE